MANISKQKREKMILFLETIKKQHNDDESIIALNEIEKALTDKKYGLLWEEHTERVDEEMKTQIPVFIEDKDREIVSDKSLPYNFILEGDNLHSLKLLEKTHKGKIDVIYIDPPYNTGNEDFIYDDKIVDSEDRFKHSKWISFMNERLKIAKRLLSKEGIIFISIDENEYSQLKILCDEIFGDINLISSLHVQVRYAEKSLADDKQVMPIMEYILIYAKNVADCYLNLPKEEYTDEDFIYEIEELSKGELVKNVDESEMVVFKPGEWKITKREPNMKLLKETWVSGSIYAKMSYGQVVKKYIEPRFSIDGTGCLYKVIGRGDDGLGYRYYVGPSRINATRCKMYSGMPLTRVNEIMSGKGSYREVPISNLLNFAPDFGNIRHEGGVAFNSGKKPVKMLKELINYHKNKNAIILDFFAGSGSTGHAILELNKQDGGNRKFILCTNNENNICEEVTYKRLENVIKNYKFNMSKIVKLFEHIITMQDLKDSTKLLEEISEIKKQNKKIYKKIEVKIENGCVVVYGILNLEVMNGIPANLKYYKTHFIDRYPENETLTELTLQHTKEMIQLENAINIEDENVLVFDEEDAERIINENLINRQKLYISSNVLLSNEQKTILNDKKIAVFDIPDYYFNFELKEVGE